MGGKRLIISAVALILTALFLVLALLLLDRPDHFLRREAGSILARLGHRCLLRHVIVDLSCLLFRIGWAALIAATAAPIPTAHVREALPNDLLE